MNQIIQSSFRRQPTDGTIFRMPLSDGSFAYGLTIYASRMWLFDFITEVPAKGFSFFSTNQLLVPVNFWDIPVTFVNCGKVTSGTLNEVPESRFYYKLDERKKERLGVEWEFATSQSGVLPMDAMQITQREIDDQKLHLYQWLTWNNYEDIINEWRPQMEIREVPPEFLDTEAIRKMEAGEPVEEKPLPQPKKVKFLIILQQADLESDEPELDIEEPLEEALDNSGCGSIGGSGTAPGVFEINVDTLSSDRARCLGVIRRVLKKAKAPPSTIIRELTEPPMDHPLEEPKPVKKKKPKRK